MSDKEIETIKDHFSKIGDKWEARDPGNRYHYYWHDENFLRFADIKKGQRTLDVGSGIATLAIGAYNRGSKSHALDVTPKMLEAGKKNAKKHNAKIIFHLGNAEKTKFKSKYFDNIISSGVPEHTPNPKKFIREMYRILKPGGELNLQVMGDKNPLMHLYLKLNKNNFRLKNIRGPAYYTRLMKEQGFEVESIKGSVFLAFPYSKMPGRLGLCIAKAHLFIEDYLLKPLFNTTRMNFWAYAFFIKAKKR